GWLCWNRPTRGTSHLDVKAGVAETVTRARDLPSLSRPIAPAKASKPSFNTGYKVSPSEVSRTCRVRRSKSDTPTYSSNDRTRCRTIWSLSRRLEGSIWIGNRDHSVRSRTCGRSTAWSLGKPGNRIQQMLTRVRTNPDVYEPFLLSQGIRMGDVLYISGQAGY